MGTKTGRRHNNMKPKVWEELRANLLMLSGWEVLDGTPLEGTMLKVIHGTTSHIIVLRYRKRRGGIRVVITGPTGTGGRSWGCPKTLIKKIRNREEHYEQY